MIAGACLEFGALAADSAFALGRLLVAVGALSTQPAVRPEEVADAAVLRAAIARCGHAAADGAQLPEGDVATINSFAGDEAPVPVLRSDGSRVLAATDPVRAALAAVARDAIETLASARGTLRVCEGPRCEVIFVDRSRAGKRRWCSMTRCGNLTKVTAFRRRRQR
jgi:predicted RNA-binding Zn ribbon-like protein